MRIRNSIKFTIVLVCLVFSTYPVVGQVQVENDDLAQSATWKPATRTEIQTGFTAWLEETNATDEVRKNVSEFIAMDVPQEGTVALIDQVVDGIVIARPDVNQIREDLRGQRDSTRPPDFSSLMENSDEKQFMRDHVRLFYARWLTQNEFYDEASQQFAKLKIENVLDPATLLFYRGLIEHQLLKKDACVETIEKLLENSGKLPKRYEVLSKLMLADIKPLESDSLDEISRMMNDIRRRTGLNRSGRLVIDQEETVIKKLDKLIEQLEAQAAAQQQGGGNTAPSSPMNDSMKAAGKGSGEVKSKRQNDGGDWGDLPPADRAAALAEMAKDMPPHYRAVIEEYFRQLAKEDQ